MHLGKAPLGPASRRNAASFCLDLRGGDTCAAGRAVRALGGSGREERAGPRLGRDGIEGELLDSLHRLPGERGVLGFPVRLVARTGQAVRVAAPQDLAAQHPGPRPSRHLLAEEACWAQPHPLSVLGGRCDGDCDPLPAAAPPLPAASPFPAASRRQVRRGGDFAPYNTQAQTGGRSG